MNRLKCNLTQQWWDREKEDLLSANGFSMRGSDYEIFYKLCLCIERLNREGVMHYQSALNVLYPELSLPISAQNANPIWRETSKLLTERGETYSLKPNTAEKGTVPISKLALEHIPTVEGVRMLESFAATDSITWNDWQSATEKRMVESLCEGMTFSLTLPVGFQWQKPNLYAVNRHLAGEECNEALWVSQLLYFLFSLAGKIGFRPLLHAECPVSEVVRALDGIRLFGTSAPIFYSSPVPVSREELLALCRAIEWREEGVRPVYLVRKPSEQAQFLGTFGDISIIPRDL